jgi:tetratricopeptide (TPR) repeat protein
VIGARIVGAALALLVTAPSARLVAQRAPDPIAPLISRALDHENAGRYREALLAWRAVVDAGSLMAGVLGLERVLAVTGDEEALLPLLDSLLPLHPRDVQLRGAQLRTLVASGRNGEADAAYRAWRDLRADDPAPYRDYARILLFHNRAAAADSVLREASAALGSSRAFLLEAAQMRAALGRWREAAEAWRETMREQPYYESAAVFSLGPAPSDARDAIRAELVAGDAPIGARQALALLELGWGQPRAGWRALAGLPPTDTTVAVWRTFAAEAEQAQAWPAVRDALVAVHAARREPAAAERGALAALRANDPSTAITLARAARAPGEDVRIELLTVELEALARLGRGEEAEHVLRAATPTIGESAARSFARSIAWAWIRGGNVEKARAAIAEAPLDADDAVGGWLALYDGDLVTARRALRFGETSAPEAVQALALLTRTRTERSPELGAAFLALAGGDSSAAAEAFVRVAASLEDAASLLLTMAARIETARGRDAGALPLWTRVAESYAAAPEAPEARLEWARALRRSGDARGARSQLEHLILTYPTSALVPQARRELDALPATRAES